MINSENTVLNESQKQRVLQTVEKLGITCDSCGASEFEVGEALHMGHMWYNEEHGVYMVALRCEDCDTPTGIKLYESQFLRDGDERKAGSLRIPLPNTIASTEAAFLHELSKIYDAEHRFLVGTKDMAQLAKSMPLRWALENHAMQTRQHIANINQIFERLDREPVRKTNGGAQGLLSTGHVTFLSLAQYSTVRDCLINAEAIKVEHFEIASYRSLITSARFLGLAEISHILESNLREEEETARIAEMSFPVIHKKAMVMEKWGLRAWLKRARLISR